MILVPIQHAVIDVQLAYATTKNFAGEVLYITPEDQQARLRTRVLLLHSFMPPIALPPSDCVFCCWMPIAPKRCNTAWGRYGLPPILLQTRRLAQITAVEPPWT